MPSLLQQTCLGLRYRGKPVSKAEWAQSQQYSNIQYHLIILVLIVWPIGVEYFDVSQMGWFPQGVELVWILPGRLDVSQLSQPHYSPGLTTLPIRVRKL